MRDGRLAVNFRGFCFVVVIVGVFAFLLAVVVENFAKRATTKKGGEEERETAKNVITLVR